MGRRNRKRSRMDGFMLPTRFAGLMVALSVLALAYVWLGCRCEVLGRDIRGLEKEREILVRRCLNEEYKWTRMKSPRQIEKALQLHNIVMAWPRNDQVVRLHDVNVLRDRQAKSAEEALSYAGLEKVVMNE